MSILLFELFMLCMIGYGCWWLGRRSFQAGSTVRNLQTLQEIQEVQEAVQRLLRVLEEKAVEIETRLQYRFDQLSTMENKAVAVPDSATQSFKQPSLELRTTAQDESLSTESASSLYERAISLLNEGIDFRTIARVTGLTVAEIETAARMQELRTDQQRVIAE